MVPSDHSSILFANADNTLFVMETKELPTYTTSGNDKPMLGFFLLKYQIPLFLALLNMKEAPEV